MADTFRRMFAAPAATPAVCFALGVAWLVMAGAGFLVSPGLFAALAFAPIVIWLILSRGWFRALVVIVGGMLVLGSGSDVGANKLVYSALLLACVAVAGWRLLTAAPPWAFLFRPLVIPGVLLTLAIIVGAALSPLGTDPQTLVRQGLFYFLVVAAPVVAIDSARDMKREWLYPLIGALGIVAATGFAADWLSRRGVSGLPFGRYVLSSLIFPSFAFALALTQVALRPGLVRRVGWFVVALAIPVAMLVTGTRTNLVIFAAALGIVGRRRFSRVPVPRLVIVLAALIGVGIAVFPLVASVSVSDPAFLHNRFDQLVAVVSGNAGADESYTLRNEQYGIAAGFIQQYPLFGFGVGWQQTITLDTPLLAVVKLGIVGVAALALFVAAIAWVLVRTARVTGYSPAHTAAWGLLVVIPFSLPFGSPSEDRGFGFAILLALLAVAVEVNCGWLSRRSG